jgi:D-arabinose 1-dehydrogenase-like Zn-dependent alcohol dehydrogenase
MWRLFPVHALKIRKLEEANEALDDLEQARVAGRQVLVP